MAPMKISHAEMCKNSASAIEYAQRVRSYHAKRSRRGAKQRESDLGLALDRLRAAMRPIRSEIASYPFKPLREASVEDREKIISASKAIQRERRKLWKMRKR